MVIDERREKIDISDHCLIEVELDKERREKEERKFYSTDNGKMEEYRAEVEKECVEWGNMDINEFNKIVM